MKSLIGRVSYLISFHDVLIKDQIEISLKDLVLKMAPLSKTSGNPPQLQEFVKRLLDLIPSGRIFHMGLHLKLPGPEKLPERKGHQKIRNRSPAKRGGDLPAKSLEDEPVKKIRKFFLSESRHTNFPRKGLPEPRPKKERSVHRDTPGTAQNKSRAKAPNLPAKRENSLVLEIDKKDSFRSHPLV